jgi:hypothetical protein
VKLRIGGNSFSNVTIPVLWGTRAVLQHESGSLSIVNLGGSRPRVEVLKDKPAPRSHFIPVFGGFSILSEFNDELYSYSPDDKRLTSKSLDLPDCQVLEDVVRIGSNAFSKNMVAGAGVGILVTNSSIALGAPLPPDLAELVV